MGPMTDQEYQAEEDLRTLTRAEEIKKSAERVAKAKELAGRKAREAAAAFDSIKTPPTGEEQLAVGYRRLR